MAWAASPQAHNSGGARWNYLAAREFAKLGYGNTDKASQWVAQLYRAGQKRGQKSTRAVATAYLDYLYTEEAQDLIGKHFYRPVSAKAQAKYAKQFPTLKLFSIDQAFGGWAQANKAHFLDGAMFDQIMIKK